VCSSDLLTGTLYYAGERVAMATMRYKQDHITYDLDDERVCTSCIEDLQVKAGKTQVNLKLIPDVDGTPAIAQLVSYNMTDIDIKGAWSGPARLHLVPHVNAPVADLPVRNVIGAMHFVADMTLPYGTVAHDYLKSQ